MKLIEYLPNFMQDIKEFKELFSAEDIEIEQLKIAIKKIFSEIIVKTAESYGLDRYEKIYNIQNNTTDIPVRRYMILSKINNKLPYTENWLKNKLNNTIGEDNYTINIDYNNYSVKIEIMALYKDIALLLNMDLKEQLSANMQLTVNLFQAEQSQQYFAGIIHTGDFLKLRQVI